MEQLLLNEELGALKSLMTSCELGEFVNTEEEDGKRLGLLMESMSKQYNERSQLIILQCASQGPTVFGLGA